MSTTDAIPMAVYSLQPVRRRLSEKLCKRNALTSNEQLAFWPKLFAEGVDARKGFSPAAAFHVDRHGCFPSGQDKIDFLATTP